MKCFARIVFLALAGSSASCTSPTARLEPKVQEFKAKYPGHIQSYAGVHRQMGYAWSGNPLAQAVVFVHGSPGQWSGWVEFLLDEDLQKNFHLIAVDRPGYGGSGAGQTETSLRHQAEDVAALLQMNHSGKPAILVGHSYGGAVIAQMAADQPSKISNLVFVASSVDPALEKTKWYQYPASWWPFRALIPGALRVCNEEIMALKPELLLLQPRWKEISAGVSSLQGTGDDLVPAANQVFILDHIPKAQIQVVERVVDMNHFVPWEHPVLIKNTLLKLARLNGNL